MGRRYGPSIGRIAIATQGQIEVDGKKPAVAAIVVGSEGSQRPLTAFELVLNRKDDVSRGHGSQQQQQIRGVSESDPHHYHLCNCMQPLFLPSLLPTGERIERQKKIIFHNKLNTRETEKRQSHQSILDKGKRGKLGNL